LLFVDKQHTIGTNNQQAGKINREKSSLDEKKLNAIVVRR
jgi:hypothetical protein